jgi:hypothetical protein
MSWYLIHPTVPHPAICDSSKEIQSNQTLLTIEEMSTSGSKKEESSSDDDSSGSSSSSSDDENDTIEQRVRKYSKADRRAAISSLGGKEQGRWRNRSWTERLETLQKMAAVSGKKHKHRHVAILVERRSHEFDDLEGSGNGDDCWGAFGGDDDLMDSKGRERSSSLVVVPKVM